jgi:hypothetical protein
MRDRRPRTSFGSTASLRRSTRLVDVVLTMTSALMLRKSLGKKSRNRRRASANLICRCPRPGQHVDTVVQCGRAYQMWAACRHKVLVGQLPRGLVREVRAAGIVLHQAVKAVGRQLQSLRQVRVGVFQSVCLAFAHGALYCGVARVGGDFRSSGTCGVTWRLLARGQRARVAARDQSHGGVWHAATQGTSGEHWAVSRVWTSRGELGRGLGAQPSVTKQINIHPPQVEPPRPTRHGS